MCNGDQIKISKEEGERKKKKEKRRIVCYSVSVQK